MEAEKVQLLQEQRRRKRESVQFEFILIEGAPGQTVSQAEELLARFVVTDALFGGNRNWEATLRGEYGREARDTACRLAAGDTATFKEVSKRFMAKPEISSAP